MQHTAQSPNECSNKSLSSKTQHFAFAYMPRETKKAVTYLPRMFTQKHYPTTIAPETLDKYLANGWHPMGQAMYTCNFSFFNSKLHSAIWTRTCLRDYTFRGSNLRLMRRNGRRFRVEYRPFELSEAHEKLFERYSAAFDGRLALSLKMYLLDERDRNIFQTMETRIYDGDQLIAYSCFHLGEEGLASIIGVYDPDYRRYSLGYYTLLLEVAYGIREGFSYFYPGYVIPGNPRFDYKLRTGHIEFFQFDRNIWRPWEEFGPQFDPLQVALERLYRVGNILNKQLIPWRLLYNPFFEGNLFGLHSNSYLEQPVMLEVWPQMQPDYLVVVYYDQRYSAWVAALCELERDYFLAFCILQDMGLDNTDNMLTNLLNKVHYRFANRPEQLLPHLAQFKQQLISGHLPE